MNERYSGKNGLFLYGSCHVKFSMKLSILQYLISSLKICVLQNKNFLEIAFNASLRGVKFSNDILKSLICQRPKAKVFASLCDQIIRLAWIGSFVTRQFLDNEAKRSLVFNFDERIIISTGLKDSEPIFFVGFKLLIDLKILELISLNIKFSTN